MVVERLEVCDWAGALAARKHTGVFAERGCAVGSKRLSLINSNVINVVKLGERRGRIGIARPLPTHRRVQNQIVRRVRYPVRGRVIQLAIHVPPDLVRFPFQRINVKIL